MTWPSSFDNKNTKDINKDIYIEAANIKNTCTKNTYARDIYIKNPFFVINTYIKGIDLKNTSIKSIYIRGISASNINSIGIIKSLEIHLQLS